MKNLLSIGLYYVVAGAAAMIGVNAGKHIWETKIQPKLNK